MEVASEVTGGAARPAPTAPAKKGASVPASVFNLVKNIVGGGILALPGGVAAFSQAKGAVVPAAALTAVLGLLSAYCFSLIGRVCAATGASSYGEAWALSVDENTAWMPSGSTVAKTFFACLSYSIIIGDVFADVMQTMGAPALLARRCNILSLVSAVVLLPLCSLKDLGPLSYTSLLGIGGTAYTAVVMALRYFDGSYGPGGRFFSLIPEAARASFSGGAALNPLALILVSMLSTSFIAHYNAPKYYQELEKPSVGRFNFVVGPAHLVAVLTFIAMTAFPFLTFGGNSMGFILNNYSTADRLATLCRLAIGGSIVFGYPLTFITAREGMLGAFGVPKPSDRQTKVATAALLAAFTAVGIVLRDLGFVVSFGGAVLGSALIYIFPAVMWISKCDRETATSGVALKGWRRAEYYGAFGVAGIGVVLGVLGAVISTLKTFVW